MPFADERESVAARRSLMVARTMRYGAAYSRYKLKCRGSDEPALRDSVSLTLAWC